MRTLVFTLAASLLAIPAFAAEAVLTPHGYDWLKIRETSTRAAAAGSPVVPTPRERDDPSICGEYDIGETGIGYLTEEMRVARVSVSKPGVATAEGIQVGDAATKVRQVYGDTVRKEGAPYADPPAHDLYVWETPDYGYRFEIDDRGAVRAIHAGSRAIGYMEGCL